MGWFNDRKALLPLLVVVMLTFSFPLVSADNGNTWLPNDIIPLDMFIIMLIVAVGILVLGHATGNVWLAFFGLALIFVAGWVLENDQLGVQENFNITEVGGVTDVDSYYTPYEDGHFLGWLLMVGSVIWFFLILIGGGGDED